MSKDRGQDKERFEAAMIEAGYELDYLILDGSERYAYMETEWAFRGWELGSAAERRALRRRVLTAITNNMMTPQTRTE